MDLRKEKRPAGPVVAGFSGGGFRVGDTVYARGLIIDPHAAHEWDAPASADGLNLAMLQGPLALDPPPEFLLLGTGPRLVQPPRAFVAAVEALGIGVEAMDSRAAARAWGVLRQEERWIVAALMPLG